MPYRLIYVRNQLVPFFSQSSHPLPLHLTPEIWRYPRTASSSAATKSRKLKTVPGLVVSTVYAGVEFAILVIKALASDVDKEGGTIVKEIGEDLDYLSND